MAKFSLSLVLILLVAFIASAIADLPILNDRPVIGILAQPVDVTKMNAAYPNRQYIAASYIKYIESAGGRVVPLSWTMTREQTEKLLPKLNGVLLTGGDSVYADVIDYIYDVAINLNNQGIHYPVWATCQGFQFTGIYFARDRNFLGNYEVYNQPLHLNLTQEADKSIWFSKMPQDLKTIIGSPEYNATMNFHHLGIGMQSFAEKLADQFYLISTNHDANGVEHVSTMEHKKYPFTSVQWHPEKTNFEFAITAEGRSRHTTPHTFETILVTQYCSNWFVHECRKNANKFDNWQELQALLIYNYNPVREDPSGFVQNYMFDTFW